jgi:hypothetical protein
MDAGGTSPRTGEGRTMQELLSRVTQDAVTENNAGTIVEEQLPRHGGAEKI